MQSHQGKDVYDPTITNTSGYTSHPPPGPPPYPGHPPPPGTTIIHAPAVSATIVPGTIIVQPMMGPSPSNVRCPTCNHDMITRVEKSPTTRTHLWAFLCCLVGLWPCMCIPYCMDSCLNSNHYCTRCGAYVGTHIY